MEKLRAGLKVPPSRTKRERVGYPAQGARPRKGVFSMRDWFAKQYADVRGNLKWWLVASSFLLLYSYGKKVLGQIPHIPGWLASSVLFLLSVVAFVWIVNLATRSTKSKVPDVASDASAKTWHDTMAEEDAANIKELIKTAKQRILFHYAPGSEPYIEIVTDLWNGSIFKLVCFGEINGHGKYAGKELALSPRIVASVEPVLLTLKHGGSATLTVRQYISADLADTMWANKDRGIAVDLEPIYVKFTVLVPYGCSLEKNSEYWWWGPRFSMQNVDRI